MSHGVGSVRPRVVTDLNNFGAKVQAICDVSPWYCDVTERNTHHYCFRYKHRVHVKCDVNMVISTFGTNIRDFMNIVYTLDSLFTFQTCLVCDPTS